MENVLGSQITRRKPIIPSNIFAMMIFVITEVMFFIGLISSFLVIRKDRGGWELPNNITLPVAMTGVNTFILLLSGVFLFLAAKKYSKTDVSTSSKLVLVSSLLGLTFVAIQGYEWVSLMSYGLTVKSGIFSALFFLIIGSHGAHALIGAFVLLYGYVNLKKGHLGINGIYILQIFWFFIVGVWPLLYGLVYFS
ncbi:MAG: hypothetical protein HOO06_05500 [Bdellovibrionaceae bacterium]|jgi:cytochrome c oxidase subunit III|nr:hypothetical protein [Pseudobdellovibrionaceae bacterium]